MLMLLHYMSPGHYILNGSDARGGDEGVAEIVATEVVVVVLETVVDEEESMVGIVEEAKQTEDTEEAEILREDTAKEIVVETVAEEG